MVLGYSFLLALFIAFSLTSAQSVDGSKYNNPTAGPPSSYFAAATSIPVASLKSASAKASTAAKDATYPINSNSGAAKVLIHSDWTKFTEGAAFVWIADMDVDCDGIDYKCKVDTPHGRPLRAKLIIPRRETKMGSRRPTLVLLPLMKYRGSWYPTNSGLPTALPFPETTSVQLFGENSIPGNRQAQILTEYSNGKMFYGIYGDSDGDDPQVIGEASWLMARTCFPKENLNGNSGHDNVDVTYILFTGKDAVLPTSALNKNFITNFTTLRSMGDRYMGALVKNLGLSGGSGAPITSGGSRTKCMHLAQALRRCLILY
ncbi:hypothetical protein N7466_009327 [Penicillium verhagenii]|uniref:uncharacterized protein n=1 Tax=Penicillium verhagenii TaxID=1562060 RepID=UPI002544F848|nr:uncharacterized protein N7466_009327 [Penicillium verhagenii]KAJ5921001.1 hypothetical protein N7466_009327 [Penicillium verhagenii]